MTLATGQNSPWGLAVDSTSVYWTNEYGTAPGGNSEGNLGRVMKVAIDGGPPVTLASKQVQPTAIAVDATGVYFANYRTIAKVGLDGGTPVTLASTKDVDLEVLAVDATSVYWATSAYPPNSPPISLVKKMPLSGGPAAVLGTGPWTPHALVVDATSVYWRGSDYWHGGEILMKVPIGGGAPLTLASDESSGSSLAGDATSIYWTTKSGLKKMPLDGGTPVTLGQLQGAIAVDATSVYGFNYGSPNTATGAVVKVPLDGGTPVTLATGQPGSGSIAVDAKSVYWIVRQSGSNPISGKVMKLTPK